MKESRYIENQFLKNSSCLAIVCQCWHYFSYCLKMICCCSEKIEYFHNAASDERLTHFLFIMVWCESEASLNASKNCEEIDLGLR